MKRYLFILFCIGCVGRSQAQQDTATIPAADSAITKSTLTLGAVYANNASYYGQRAEKAIPYAALAASFRSRSGFYLTGLAYRLLHDTGSFVSAGSAGVGFAHALGKKFSIDLSYAHTFYPAHSPFLQAGNPDNATIALGYDNWLSTKLSGDVAFGNTHDYFVTASIGKQVNLGHFSAKDVITFTPTVDVTAGTQRFYQTYLTQKRITDSLAGIILSPITGTPPSQNPKTTVTTSMDILSYNLKCPLAYNRSHYLVELAYQLSLLSNKAQSAPGKLNSFLTASFYYQF